ncbi:hypothetical protein R1sor_005039 [Riccia sorocarpa]|uniref:DUF4218 domain-containing protein n=1 Tax=Riccia sorocarpa TaxID=122646 RepID=A0ABD3HIY1_9MARC
MENFREIFRPNPGVKSSSHSTWPVVLTNYNVPPWLASKKGFLLLALIIPGPKKVRNIDIYLEPLVEELQQLWTGVDDVYDGRTERIGRDRWFTLKGVLLWTMHDYPGYAQVSGFQTSGYAACPTCGPALPVARSSHLSKQVYMSYSTFLPMDDPLRGTGAERNTTEPPIPLDMYWWEQRWRDVEEGHIPAERAGLKRWSILHRLPYWKDLMIQHLLDPMHIEANVTKSLIKRIFGEKDGKPARRACEEFGVHPEAWIQVSDGGIESLPPAPWILTTEERKICKKRISEIRFPTGFGSCLRKGFEKDGPKWPSALKSHDYHILLQYVLPICLQGLGTQDLRDAICDLSVLMRWVCSKTIRIAEIDEKELFAVTTLCKLERTLPPDYFDSQIHLLVHLVREVSICGPVHGRWMYWLERYMKVMKDDVRQKARPEGSMAEGHRLREAMFLCSNILEQLDQSSAFMLREKEETHLTSLKLIGSGEKRRLTQIEVMQAHNFVLHNSAIMEEWTAVYEDERRAALASRRRGRPVRFPSLREFMREKLLQPEALAESSGLYPPITEDIRILRAHEDQHLIDITFHEDYG